METDPKDGSVEFCVIDTEGFVIKQLSDVVLFWSALFEVGKELYEEKGHIVYPIVEL